MSHPTPLNMRREPTPYEREVNMARHNQRAAQVRIARRQRRAMVEQP